MGVSLILAFALGVSVSCKQRTTDDSQTKDVAAAGQTPILQLLAALNPVGTALAQPGGGGLVTKCEKIKFLTGHHYFDVQNWANTNCKNGILTYSENTNCCQSPQ